MLDWLVLLVRGSIIVSGLPAVRLDSPMPAVISAGLASLFAGEHAACARGHDELRHSTGSRPQIPIPSTACRSASKSFATTGRPLSLIGL
jgi:hypothetical protein